MKRIRITHQTEYHYHTPVTFGPHRALMRPREGHHVRIASGRVEIEPAAEVRWLRDIDENAVAIVTFSKPGYPHDGPALQNWLLDLYRPGQLIDTFDLLNRLNTRIHDFLRYGAHDHPGVQLPCETLAKGSGSCRDYAVLMMEAARHWGFGARFVSGYIQMAEGQHGSTHAWTEIYLPGAGWHGFDPTNNKRAGTEHIPVAVAREQEKTMPLTGSWDGPTNAFDRMEISVQVVPV